jgi:hypothetical protein
MRTAYTHSRREETLLSLRRRTSVGWLRLDHDGQEQKQGKHDFHYELFVLFVANNWDYTRIEPLVHSSHEICRLPGDGAEFLLPELCFSGSFMYKFIVSCYYWPAGERSLRLRASIIKQLSGYSGTVSISPDVGRLTSLEDKLAVIN